MAKAFGYAAHSHDTPLVPISSSAARFEEMTFRSGSYSRVSATPTCMRSMASGTGVCFRTALFIRRFQATKSLEG